ncbi:hypothetical protein ACFV80_35150 [Streptomyces sp. NPDC059862]
MDRTTKKSPADTTDAIQAPVCGWDEEHACIDLLLTALARHHGGVV